MQQQTRIKQEEEEEPEMRRSSNLQQEKKKQQPSSFFHLLWFLVRSLLLDLPLALFFLSFLSIVILSHVHQNFYTVLFNRSQRTDHDLLREYTYYERFCTDFDVTKQSGRDTFDDVIFATPHDSSDIPTTVSAAQSAMLQHGMIALPDLFPPNLTASLRRHVVTRNAAVVNGSPEAFPVSQGELGLRASFGMDATEAPAVTESLQYLAHHPLLRPLLASLTGDPYPASAEITAITAYAGADAQTWHADTKSDGNAVKYARTYSHSYSLFIPLQDTTRAMGATELCFGTQHCANDLTAVCERYTVSLEELGGNSYNDKGEQIIPAGSGKMTACV